jgi:parallel beta-helix repeat protein
MTKNGGFTARGRRRSFFAQVETIERRLLLSTYTVVNTNDDGPGSLRDAITQVDNGTDDIIDFDIPGTGPFTISPASPLPAITAPVYIDGTSQPGYAGAPLIDIDGATFGVPGDGITLAPGSDFSDVIGLDLSGFASGAGIDIASSGNGIQANYLGTDPSGTVAQGNQSGIAIDQGSDNVIGGESHFGQAINYAQGFTDVGSQLQLNGTAEIQDDRLRLTNGGYYETASSFVANPVDISQFMTSFEFQITSGQATEADGFTFTIQGDGPQAIDTAGGGGLGYGYDSPGGPPGIPASVAIKFDLYDNAGEGDDSTGMYEDGASPTVPATPLSNTGINLHSADPFEVAMSYTGSVLSVTITDQITGASATHYYDHLNIQALIGSDSAYVGFTAATGGYTATQDIVNWQFQTDLAVGNLISGNAVGVALGGDAAGNIVEANKIGTDATGSKPLPNTTDGVDIDTSNNMVGEPADGLGNTIAFNGQAGVHVLAGAGNTIRGNSIYNNGAEPILLDPDANGDQPAPQLSSAQFTLNGTQLVGELNDFADNSTFTLDVYGGAAGGVNRYVATFTVTTNASGAAEFDTLLPRSLAGDEVVTATATSSSGDTSSWSNGVAQPGPLLTVTTTADDGAGSLRQAILDANKNRPPNGTINTITFDVASGPRTFAPATALPMITAPVTIDGATQPGYAGTSLIEIDGEWVTGDGLTLASGSGGSTIKGLDIYGFGSGAGIDILSGGNQVLACAVGIIEPSERTSDPNATGILIELGANNNSIGGTTSGAGNIIAGNIGNGIEIQDVYTNGNVVEGDLIGNDGSVPLPNGANGVFIGSGAKLNTIGGSTQSARNIISGNIYDGVDVAGSETYFNVVAGNDIGNDGASSLPNGADGVVIETGAQFNIIGGSAQSDLNIIAGNTRNGVEVDDADSSYNEIAGNFIGNDGTASLPNGADGVLIDLGASDNFIGGSAPGDRNIISGNTSNGVDVEDSETLYDQRS